MHVILNWIWQGGVVAAAAAGLLAFVPRSYTQSRYWLLWVAYVLMLAPLAVPQISVTAFAESSAADSWRSWGPAVSIPSAWWTSIEFAGGLWMAWSTLYAIRLTRAVLEVQLSKSRCRECPYEVQARLNGWLGVRTTGRRTRLVLSNDVASAAVLGCGSPVIAVAPALIERLSDADLDRVVIHEWAHVQRRDDVAQLIQRMVYLVAGWHPAMWWLQRQMDLEREVACDEIAVAMTGSAKGYAECLTALAALLTPQVRSRPVLAAVSAAGLRARLVRILAPRHIVTPWRWRAVFVGGGVALAALASAVGNIRLIDATATSLNRSVPPPMTGLGGTHRHPLKMDAMVATGLSPTVRARSPAPSAPSSVAEPRRRSVAGARPLKRAADSLPDGAPATPDADPESSAQAERLPSSNWPPASWTLTAVAPLPPGEAAARAPWAAAADAGGTVGRASQNAGLATAGFFGRFGRKISGSFVR